MQTTKSKHSNTEMIANLNLGSGLISLINLHSQLLTNHNESSYSAQTRGMNMVRNQYGHGF